MTPQQTPQQILRDTADSLAAAQDTTAVVTDTGQGLGRLTRDLQEGLEAAGEAARQGDVTGFVQILYTSLFESLVDFIPSLLSALFVLLLLYILYRFLDRVLGRVLTRSRRVDAGLQGLLMKSYRVAMLTLIAVMVLAQLDVNVTALLAGLSIAGIAVGFAARDTLENFISGVTILLDKPFRVGDQVEVEDLYGTVEEITLRSTRLRSLNNTILVLPNVHMIQNKLVNHSMLGLVRVEVPFGIAYKEYPEEARRVVLKLTEGDGRLHPNFPPSVVVTGLNDSSVDLVLRLYLKNPKQEVPVRFEYIERVREALREADIEIPFPHLQLFIDEAKAFEEAAITQPQLPLRRVD